MKDTKTHARIRDLLSNYADGHLSQSERTDVDQHLAACSECRDTVDAIHRIKEEAGNLPVRRPDRDLWPTIAQRITAQPISPSDRELAIREPRGPSRVRRFSFSAVQLAAAVVTVASLAGLSTWVMMRDDAVEPQPLLAAEPGAFAVLTGAEGAELLAPTEYYVESIRALEAALFGLGQPLPEQTSTRIRTALGVIDAAIDEAMSALEDAPDDPYLEAYMVRALRHKTEYLRRALNTKERT